MVSQKLNSELRIGNTLEAVSSYAQNDTKTILPAQKLEAIRVIHAPGATGLKIADIMIKSAGGRLADDVWHEVPACKFYKTGLKHLTQDELEPIFVELRNMTYVIFDPNKGKEGQSIIGGLIDVAILNYDQEHTKARFKFSEMFRDLVAKSNHYAVIDRQTSFALRTKYSILLFQNLSTFFNLDKVWFKQYSVDELRAIMNVPDNTNELFKAFNRDVLKPAIRDINYLSRFNISMETIKDGRKVKAIKFIWKEKPDLALTKQELNNHKTGRKARQNKTSERVVLDIPFPSCGGFSDDKFWLCELRKHWPDWSPKSNNSSTLNIAEHLRKILKKQKIEMNDPKILEIFENIIKKWGKI